MVGLLLRQLPLNQYSYPILIPSAPLHGASERRPATCDSFTAACCLQVQCRKGEGACPRRSFLTYSTNCPDWGLAAGSDGYSAEWVLERAPAVAGQPTIHGQFYLRAAVSAVCGCACDLA